MNKKIIDVIKDRPFLSILCLILAIITISNIKPDYYLIGWDNYSSYFNLKTNIFRTIFATWRDYRGLGVPSDAEVTDIFRQLLFWIWHFFLPENLLDQVYYQMALWLGVLGMYGCGRMLFRDFKFTQTTGSELSKDIFGFLAAFLYLFNLNTLSVFYSPIIPFANRFFGLPVTMYIFLKYLEEKNNRWLSLLIIAIIFTSGSYITPTIVITSLLAFFIFFAVRSSFLKAIQYCMIFLLLNAFWILPFLNYTVEKSGILPLARTFVEINESTLNRPATTFFLQNQAILTPSFFDIRFPTLSGKVIPIHPLLDLYQSPAGKMYLSIFGLLYGTGSLLILIHWRHNKNIVWIPLWIITFLFLAGQEYSPLGILYAFIKIHIPLFAIIFRIGDTKFHAYISFAGSLAAAYCILACLSALHRKHLKSLYSFTVFLFILITFWFFRSYFTGGLLGYFVFTKIPPQYKVLAQKINSFPGHGRVLHLPMDTWHSYWRSFSWGYLGSSFFNFFLDKPYLDKTFEPASLENSYFHTRITDVVESFYRSRGTPAAEDFLLQFSKLLKTTGTQFIIFDESINSRVPARDLQFTGKQYSVHAKEILDDLYRRKMIVPVYSTSIDISEFRNAYQRLSGQRSPDISAFEPDTQLVLYEVRDISAPFELPSAVTNIDSHFQNLLESPAFGDRMTVLQDDSKPAIVYPFRQQSHTTNKDERFTFRYPSEGLTGNSYVIKTQYPEDKAYAIDIYGSNVKNNLTLTFYHRYYPDVQGKRYQKPIGTIRFTLPLASGESIVPNASILGRWRESNANQILDGFRLRVDDIFLPLPSAIGPADTYISSILVHDSKLDVTLLVKDATVALDANLFRQTDPSSCFGPVLPGYTFFIDAEKNTKLNLSARNGSVCAYANLPNQISNGYNSAYAEIEMGITAYKQATKSSPDPLRGQSVTERVIDATGDKPFYSYVCVHEAAVPECLNSKKYLRISKRSLLNTANNFLIPLGSVISPASPVQLLVSSVNPDNTLQTIALEQVKLHSYKNYDNESLTFEPEYPQEIISLTAPLTLSFPNLISPYSYTYDPKTELFSLPVDTCKGNPPKLRTMRVIGDALFTYMENCSTYYAQQVELRYGEPYLFRTEYWKGSGQQPVLVIGKNSDDIFMERASLYQGYPNLKGMNQFQDLIGFLSYSAAAKNIQAIKLTPYSRLLEPQYASQVESSELSVHLFQESQNVGLTAVGAFDMIEYPLSWYGLRIEPVQKYTLPEFMPRKVMFAQLLPSLWKVNDLEGGSIIRFNEGYDSQWGVYRGVAGVLFGRRINERNVRCDGFANCFIFNRPIESGKDAVYVFYFPERMAMAGWILTAVSVFLIIGIAKKSVFRSS